MKQLGIIGRAERIDLIDHGVQGVVAKVDTGADMSSIWASDIYESDNDLTFVLFGEKSPYYTGEKITVPVGEYRRTRIANSFGTKELRYVIKVKVRIHGRVINAAFSLADRSSKTYPILLGRRILNKKFLVDVSQGTPLLAEERKKRKQMHIELGQDEG